MGIYHREECEVTRNFTLFFCSSFLKYRYHLTKSLWCSVLLADILSAKGEDTIAALTFISLMTALLIPADYIYTVTMRTPGTSDFTHKKVVWWNVFHQTTHKILYFNYLYILSPTIFGIITRNGRRQWSRWGMFPSGYVQLHYFIFSTEWYVCVYNEIPTRKWVSFLNGSISMR